jgi:hypothetical protein
VENLSIWYLKMATRARNGLSTEIKHKLDNLHKGHDEEDMGINEIILHYVNKYQAHQSTQSS